MARRPFTADELLELRHLAARWGKIVARGAFARRRPGLDIDFDFDMMEQIAHTAALGLTEGTLQTLLESQTAALGDEQPCPDCGGGGSPVRRHERPLHAKGVELRQNEPVAHCPVCRRDFVPSAADPAARRPRV